MIAAEMRRRKTMAKSSPALRFRGLVWRVLLLRRWLRMKPSSCGARCGYWTNVCCGSKPEELELSKSLLLFT